MKKIVNKIKQNAKAIAAFLLGIALTGGTVYAATVLPSSQVGYDNSTSGLTATDVQGALDELYTKANHCKLNFRQEFLQDVDSPNDFSRMFGGSTNIPCLDLSSWDTSSVTDMYGMFYGASSLTSLDLSNWDTSNVTNMSSMFYGASSLTSLDLSSWNTSNVTNMNRMFSGASSLTSLDLSSWNTSNDQYMNSMFSGANPNLQVTINCSNTNLINQINSDLGSGHYTCAN